MAAVLLLALLVQVFAGFALRGLYADGAFFVTQMIDQKNFFFTVPVRRTATFLVELPGVTAIMLGIATPQLIAIIFSVTTNVLPGFVFLLCRVALSAVERQFFVFPAFVYFAGTLSAQFASVAEGLISTAYVWLLFYLLLFGRLSAWRLSLILLLSIGAILLHEEMSFLGPVLIAAGGLRWRDATTQPARLVLGLALLAMFVSAAVGTYWAVFPFAPADRAALISDLAHLRWLYVPGEGCNPTTALGLAAGIAILTCIRVPKVSRVVVLTFSIAAVSLAVASFWVGGLTLPSMQYAARDNASFLSFLLMIIVLVARFVPGALNRLTSPPVQAIVMVLGVSVSLWHIQATEKWSAFLSHFRSVLASNSGIIPSAVLLNAPGTRGEQLPLLMIWDWTNPDLSIIALPRRCLTSVIDNPPDAPWQPYDLQNPTTLPRIPGITYTYLMSPERQASACLEATSANRPR